MSSLPKVSRLRTTLVNFFFHNVALVITLLYGIVLVPLYLEKIPVALYGAWLATGNILSWIELVDPGVSGILQQRTAFAAGAGNRERLGEVIITGLVLGSCFCLLPLLAWPVAPLIGGWLHISSADAELLSTSFRIGLVGTTLSLVAYALSAINIGLQLAATTGVVFTVASLAGLAATIAMLLAGLGLPALPLGLLVRALGLCLGNAVPLALWCRKYLQGSGRFSRHELRTMSGLLGFSFFTRLGTTLADRVEAFMAASMLSTQAAAVLSLTGRAYEPAKMLTTRGATALLPGLAHLAGEQRLDRAAEVVTRVSRIVGFTAAVTVGSIIALNQPFVRLWVGDELYGGEQLTLLIGLSTLASITTASLSQLTFALGGIKQTSLIAFIEAALKLALQFVLIKVIGLNGLPLAAALAPVAVGAWCLPLLLAKLTNVSVRNYGLVWAANASVGVMFALVGLSIWWAAIREPSLRWGWPMFIVVAIGVGSLFVGIGLLLMPRIRSEIGVLANALRKKIRHRG